MDDFDSAHLMSITRLELNCRPTNWQVVVIDRFMMNWLAGRAGVC